MARGFVRCSLGDAVGRLAPGMRVLLPPGCGEPVSLVREICRQSGRLRGLSLMGGLATRPASGWLMYRRPALVRAAIGSSLVAGATGILLIAIARSTPVALLGALILGLAAGVPFAPVFFGAGRVRPDAPGAAVGFVNAVGHGPIILGTPLLGLAFSIPGDGRIGFAVVAALWLVALAALPKAEDFGANPPMADRVSERPSNG